MTNTDLRAVIAASPEIESFTSMGESWEKVGYDKGRAEGWRLALARVMVEAEGSEGDFDFLAWRMRELLKEGPPNE